MTSLSSGLAESHPTNQRSDVPNPRAVTPTQQYFYDGECIPCFLSSESNLKQNLNIQYALGYGMYM